jgi:hypothetical protein
MKHTVCIGIIGMVMAGVIAGSALAEEQKFEPRMDISPQTGKWKQAVKEKPIQRIDCTVRRIAGGEDTFINFRFGDDGTTFPGGKRFYLTDDKQTSLKIPIDGMTPGNKPLVINAYNGTVKILYVTIHYRE